MLHISQTPVMRQFINGEYRKYRSPTMEPDWKVARITKRQLWYIRLLATQLNISIQSLNNSCYRQYGDDLGTMKRTDASRVIQALKRRFKPYSMRIHNI